jgi:hypothetical protein
MVFADEIFMTDLRQMRYVTAHYAHLQGLRLVPLGLPFLVSAMWRGGWLQWWPGAQGAGAGMWFVVMLAVAVGLSYLIEASYRAHFGDVQPLPGRSGAATLLLSFIAFLALAWLQHFAGWTISTALLFVAATLLRLGLVAGGLRKHYLVLAVACTAFAMWLPTETSPRALAIMRDLLIGLGLIAAGIGDDRVLRRVLQPIDSDDYASAL